MSKTIQQKGMLIISKETILVSSDYNLSGDRYRTTTDYTNAKWPMVELGEVCEIGDGNHSSNYPRSEEMLDKGIPFIRGTNLIRGTISNQDIKFISEEKHSKLKKGHLKTGDVLFTNRGEIGKLAIVPSDFNNSNLNSQIAWIRSNPRNLSNRYLYNILNSDFIQNNLSSEGATLQQFTISSLKKIKFPLPPLEIQEGIVKEIDGYQKIVDGAKMVIENWKPKIDIDAGWERVKISEICKIERGASPRPIEQFITEAVNGFNWIKIGDTKNADKYITHTSERVTKEGAEKSRKVSIGDFVLSNSMSFGKPYIMKIEGYIHDGWLRLSEDSNKISKDYLYYMLSSSMVYEQFENAATGGVVRNLNSELVRNIIVSLPPLEIQNQIVERIEEEKKLVEANKKLVDIYECKIKGVIQKIWG